MHIYTEMLDISEKACIIESSDSTTAAFRRMIADDNFENKNGGVPYGKGN